MPSSPQPQRALQADIVLRPARADETEICAAVHRASYDSWTFVDQNPHTPAEDRAWMRKVFRECAVTVAAIGDRVVGYIAVRDGFISGLWVLPDHQRQGIGTALLRYVVETTPGPLELAVFDANQGAIRLYERFGFTTINRTDGATTDEKLPDRLMRREANAPK